MRGEHRQVVELLNYRCCGSGAIVYTDELANGPMGLGDRVVVHGVVSRVGGGLSNAAQVTAVAEDSPDGEHWAELSPTVLSDTIAVSELPKTLRGEVPFPHGRYLRLKVSITTTEGAPAWLFIRGTVKPSPGE